MSQSLLMTGLSRQVSTFFQSFSIEPPKQALGHGILEDLRAELSDPRTHYVAGMGHVQPTFETLGATMLDYLRQEAKRLEVPSTPSPAWKSPLAQHGAVGVLPDADQS
jgi:hypothetical protein